MIQYIRNIFLIVFFCFISHASFSFEVDAESLRKSLSEVKLTKGHVSQMVDVLVSQGKITPQEGEKAKEELAGMSDQQMQELTQKAFSKINDAAAKDESSLEDYLKSMSK